MGCPQPGQARVVSGQRQMWVPRRSPWICQGAMCRSLAIPIGHSFVPTARSDKSSQKPGSLAPPSVPHIHGGEGPLVSWSLVFGPSGLGMLTSEGKSQHTLNFGSEKGLRSHLTQRSPFLPLICKMGMKFLTQTLPQNPGSIFTDK